MKKLTKKSLEELAKTMTVISKSEQEGFWGMYKNDCFWRCVAYMDPKLKVVTEETAATYALDYYTNVVFSDSPNASECAKTYLTESGAGMSISAIQKYIAYQVKEEKYHGVVSSGEYIAIFKINDISSYTATGEYHAVIVQSENSDGSLSIFDPQIHTYTKIPANEAGKVIRAMY